MRHHRAVVISILLVLILAMGMVATAQESTEEPEATEEPTQATQEPTEEPADEPAEDGDFVLYTIQRGDNLYRIAINNGTTYDALARLNGITNPRLIFAGQQIRIPKAGATVPDSGDNDDTSTDNEQPTDQPSGGTYVVKAGDTLYRIAVNNGTTTAELARLNGIANVNFIFVGQQLVLPGGASDAGGSGTDSPQATDEPQDDSGFVADFDYGIEIYADSANISSVASQALQLGVNWVKYTVDWRQMEPVQGQIDFTNLDAVVNTLDASGFNILLTITNAPDWARPSVEGNANALGEDGPPDDMTLYAAFASTIAQRYSGIVDAYEIWNEPNLRREWNSPVHAIGVGSYIDMLTSAHAVIKAADANVQVITGGLAPTGFNDGLNAIDDRVFLQDLFSNDVTEYSDAIGAHPNGWANPPESECCEQPPGVDTHYDNERFFFLDTLNDYRQILVRNGGSNFPIWVTSFGWGSSEGSVLAQPGRNSVFLTYTSLSEQALYIPSAFRVGRELNFVGVMFLNNLNACSAGMVEGCFYSLIDSSGAAKPAFSAVQTMDKTTASEGE